MGKGIREGSIKEPEDVFSSHPIYRIIGIPPIHDPRIIRDKRRAKLAKNAKRSLKDISKDELCQAALKLAAALDIPIRTEHYDLMLAIYDEKVKDQKASERREFVD